MKTTARHIAKGDTVTYLGQTFVAAEVAYRADLDLMEVTVAGAIPQFIAPFRSVEVVRPPVEKPYVVLTRDYDEDGNADKRRFTFATMGRGNAFLRRTKRHVVFQNW